MLGAVGGIIVGLGLRPPTAVSTRMVEPRVAVGPEPALPVPETAELEARFLALRQAVEEEQALLDALTRKRSTAEVEQQARLDALTRARAAAEAQLASLQRDIAATQRDAAAPPPRREATVPPSIVTPPLPPARPAREMPVASGQTRVFVHHRAGSAAGAEAATALLGPLREGGFEVPEIRPVPAVPSQRVVRYFHADDAAAAARLAGRLGRGWAIQDFRGYEPSPGPGTLEVWVPDR